MAKNAQNIRNAKSANIEMWPILIPPDDHWPQNMWKTKENIVECLRKNRAEWKSTKKHPKNYFLKTFPKNILFFGQNYPKICTKKDFKKNWLVTYTLGWICSGGSVCTDWSMSLLARLVAQKLFSFFVKNLSSKDFVCVGQYWIEVMI